MHSESEPGYLTTELIFFNVLLETEKHDSASRNSYWNTRGLQFHLKKIKIFKHSFH